MPGRHAAPRTPGPRTGGALTGGPVGRVGVAAILLTAAGAAVAGSTGAFAAAGAAAPAPTTQPPTTQPPTVPAAGTAMLALPTAVPAPTVLPAATVWAAPAPPVGPAIQAVVLPVAAPTTATVKYVAAVGGAPTRAAPPKAAPAQPKAAPEAKAAPDAASAGSGGSIGSRIVAEGAKHKGAPYVWGATGPSSFDCSGFTGYVFKKVGVTLPRTAQAQYDAAQHLSRSQAQPGDLIFNGSPGSIYHVAIYAGNGKIWTAPQPGESVKLGNLWGDYRVGRIR